MSPKFDRDFLSDGSFIDMALDRIKPDKWRSHGVRYRLAWVQNEECRVLFDNHHGKQDHFHVDGREMSYTFSSITRLLADFYSEIRKLGGAV